MRVCCALIAWCCLLGGLGLHEVTPACAEDVVGAGRLGDRALHGASTQARCAALRALTDHLAELPHDMKLCIGALRLVLRKAPPVERALALEAVSHGPVEFAGDLLFRHLDPDAETDERVWAAALDGLERQWNDSRRAREINERLRAAKGRPAARALLLEALGSTRGTIASMILKTNREGEPWIEVAARARALGQRSTSLKSDTRRLIDLLAHDDLAVRVQAYESLQKRTRQPLPLEAKAWLAWWQGERAAERLPKEESEKSPAKQPADKDERYAASLPVHVPTYYDVPIPRPKSKIVFCLDVSQSMYGDGIKDARRHLGKALRDLPSTHAFEIVAFNENLFPFAGRLVSAHPVQKWRAIQWLDTQETTSYTNIYDAVEAAFQHMGRGRKPAVSPRSLDMVFLLSDGAPNRGRFRNADRVVKHIGLLSRREVPVHTIAAGERVFVLLQRIAEATGGVFTDAFE